MTMRWPHGASLAVALLCLIGGPTAPTYAQDTPPAGEQPPAADEQPAGEQPTDPGTPPADPAPPGDPAPAAEPPVDPAPGDTPPADPAAPAAPTEPAVESEFTKTFAEWKELIVQLRKLQEEYKLAKPEERPPIETKFNELLAQGDALAPQLQELAEQDFAAAPNKDPNCANFLASVVYAAASDDRYDEAARVAKLLIDGGYPHKDILNFAGIAAFVVGDYDRAEQLLKDGETAGALNELGRNYLALVPEYRTLAATEKAAQDAEAQADDLPRVLLKTSKGDITIELFENEAPNTVANFISLVESGFYNGLDFHRVIGNFMAQGGDPNGDGTGGPGYTIADEFAAPNARKHFRGSLSMAKTAAPDSGGSQFFLTFVPTAHLNGKHTVFGRVIDGMDILEKLNRTEPVPAQSVDEIIEATVLRKRDHEYKPVKIGEAAPPTTPPAETPPASTPPAETPAETPPAETPPSETPPATPPGE